MKKLMIMMLGLGMGMLFLLLACNGDTDNLNDSDSELDQQAITDRDEDDATSNMLSSYVGQLNTLSQDLTQLATELETYIDMDNPEEPVNMSFNAFETYVGRMQSYIGILQNVHTNLAVYDFNELTFDDEWPGPRPTWPMVLMNLETVLLTGLGTSYDYLASYLSDSFIAPTSEALHYFIHEMDMGNPDESGFLGCINCITNLIFLLDHVGMMMEINQLFIRWCKIQKILNRKKIAFLQLYLSCL